MAQSGGASQLTGAFGRTFWVALAITIAMLAPALFLPSRPVRPPMGATGGSGEPSRRGPA